MPTKHDLQKQLDEAQDILKALTKALDALSSSMGLEDLFEIIIDSMTLLGYPLAMLHLLDKESRTLRFQKATRSSLEVGKLVRKLAQYTEPTVSIPMREKENICVKAILDGEVHTSDSIYDIVRPRATREICDEAQTSTGMRISGAVPLKVEGQTVGVLTIVSITKDTLADDELQVLKLFANQAAWAMQKERLHNILRDMSLTDQLTGLPNRRNFEDHLSRLISASSRRSIPFSILFIDVDDLKVFNDKYGHQAGDDLLKAVGDALRSAVRAEDAVYRYGGDEFVVLLQGLNAESSLEVAKRARLAAHKTAIKGRRDHAKGQVSIGIASYPQHGTESEELIHNADLAMYKAKHSEGARISIYERS